jgi:hypothetical protein
MAERVRLSRAKGWRLPPDTVVVSRPGKWGNPFIVGTHGTRQECVHLFAYLVVAGCVCATTVEHMRQQAAAVREMRAALTELRGKNLACWCPLTAPCHADILLAVANDLPLPPGIPKLQGVG